MRHGGWNGLNCLPAWRSLCEFFGWRRNRPQVNRVLTRLLEESPPPVEKLAPREGDKKPLWVSRLLHAEHAVVR